MQRLAEMPFKIISWLTNEWVYGWITYEVGPFPNDRYHSRARRRARGGPLFFLGSNTTKWMPLHEFWRKSWKADDAR